MSKKNYASLIFVLCILLILFFMFGWYYLTNYNRAKNIEFCLEDGLYDDLFESGNYITNRDGDYIAYYLSKKPASLDKLHTFRDLIIYPSSNVYGGYANYLNEFSVYNDVSETISTNNIYKAGVQINNIEDYDFLYVYAYDHFSDKLLSEYLNSVSEYVKLNVKNNKYDSISFGMINLLNIIEPKYKNDSITYKYLNNIYDKIKNNSDYNYNIEDLNYLKEQYNSIKNYKDSKKKIDEISKAFDLYGIWVSDDNVKLSINNFKNEAVLYTDSPKNNSTNYVLTLDNGMLLTNKSNVSDKFSIVLSSDTSFEYLVMRKQSDNSLVKKFKRSKINNSKYKPYQDTIKKYLVEDEEDEEESYNTSIYSSSDDDGVPYDKNNDLYRNNDKNKDGKISEDEFQSAVNEYVDGIYSNSGKYGATYDKNDDLYRNNDKNKDGKISGDEYQNSVNEYIDGIMSNYNR